MIYFNFSIEPKPIQSFKFKKNGHKYQPNDVVNFKKFISLSAISQLPIGFKPLTGGVAISIRFIFPPTKSWSKKKLTALKNGEKMYKITRPDLHDNLKKGVLDALNGVVYKDDAQVCKEVNNEKVYGFVPRIELCVCDIEEIDKIEKELYK